VATAQRHDRHAVRAAIVALRGALQRQGDEYTLAGSSPTPSATSSRPTSAIINNGGIRADLPAGMLTYGDLFQVEPFQNRLVRLTVTATCCAPRSSICWRASGRRARLGRRGVYDARSPGRRITKIRLADGKGHRRRSQVHVGRARFLATGGSGFAMLTSAPAQDAGIVDVDALITYLSVLPKPVAPPDDPRLHAKGGR